ncbi:pentatricopeptide repeat-containing protein 2, mitochondrial-like [Scylla paramamosain]|uniref:pentatricopeptide repeat-containing protein 2, mitochondrial-like n=1 Tax=Scylla paramamosain TaxID=85552 RepID=UPI00308383E6
MAVCNTRASSVIFRRVLPSLRHPLARSGTLPLPCLPENGRQLYTPAALGLDQYTHLRTDTRARFASGVDSFKAKMREILTKNDTAMIFTEDLKNVLHLAEGNEEDMKLVRDMAIRFNKQHQGLRFGMYVFGPVVMRTYHTLRQPQEALEALNDPQLTGFFDQLISYQVAMDLLFEVGQFQQVLDTFGLVQDRRVTGVRYPKNCLTLAVAACYKMGTQESFHHLQELLQSMADYGIPLNRRLATLGAALALSVGHPHVALDLVLRSSSATHITVRSIKVMALCQLRRVEEAVLALRSITEIDLPRPARSNQGIYILREAVREVEEAVKEAGRKDQVAEFGRIQKCLEEAGAISDKSLEEVLCQPIDKFEKRVGQDRAILSASFAHPPTQPRHARRHAHPSAPRPPKRQGLLDME